MITFHTLSFEWIFLGSMSVHSPWSLFLALTCQNLVWGEGVEDSWLFVTAVEGPLNGKGMFWITGGFKSPPATSEWQQEQKKQRVLSFTEAETTTDNLGPCSTALESVETLGKCVVAKHKKISWQTAQFAKTRHPIWRHYHQLPFSDWLQHLQVNGQLNGNRCQNSYERS